MINKIKETVSVISMWASDPHWGESSLSCRLAIVQRRQIFSLRLTNLLSFILLSMRNHGLFFDLFFSVFSRVLNPIGQVLVILKEFADRS